MNDQAITKPTIADQAAAIDAAEVAARIVAQGARAAIGASTIEIVAMATRMVRLAALADLTFEMLTLADELQEARDLDARKVLAVKVKRKIDVVGASLEALGYGQQQPPQQEENTNGTAS
jgi:hypothetical protein